MPLLQPLLYAHQAHYNRYQLRKALASPRLSPKILPAILEQLTRHPIKWLTHFTPPGLDRLTHLHPSPIVLFYRGNLSLLLSPTVTVIGTRTPSAQGILLAKQTGALLSRAGCCVVSGMARGIDGWALRSADQSTAHFPAIAVLGTAITQCYPESHFGLYQALCQKGLVLSEYPPGFQTQPFHFLLRNEIMAALGDIIVVVEAGEKSGTSYTVTAALSLGKPILTFPLPAKGNQRLLDEGAQMIRCPQDLLPHLYTLLHQQLKSP